MIVHIIDNDDATRLALDVLLQGEGLRTKSYSSAADFLDSINETVRGCVVTELTMPGIGGIELISRLRKRAVALPVIVISARGSLALAVQAMKEGAVDFIEKPYSAAALLGAVHNATLAGEAPESADLTMARENLSRLSPREKEVLTMLVSGLPNKMIAINAGLSIRTVESHRAAIMKKMGGGSFAELVRKCIAIGLDAEEPHAR